MYRTDPWRRALNDFESNYLGKSEWIWVTGYKGTDKDMKCKNDFQYELGKRYDMPDGESVEVCSSGFHLCLKLEDVFEYIVRGRGNRFFEVEAFVRKSDVDNYGNIPLALGLLFKTNKLAAKSIVLTRELTADEILASIPESAEWPSAVKEVALTGSIEEATKIWHKSVLISMGYVRPLAEYIVNHCDKTGYDLAVALNSQPDISMDTKINAIFSHI